jgi:hypothetical protein
MFSGPGRAIPEKVPHVGLLPSGHSHPSKCGPRDPEPRKPFAVHLNGIAVNHVGDTGHVGQGLGWRAGRGR